MNADKIDLETITILSKKYAQAFINLYFNQLSLDLVYNLEGFIEYLDNNKEAFVIIKIPIFKEIKKKEIFSQLLKKFNLIPIFQKIIDLLMEDNRLILLSSTLSFIAKIYKEKLNIVDFHIVSSHKLTKDQVNDIMLFLKSQTGKIINYTLEVDNRLIAGLKIYSDNLGFEKSIRNQLSLLNSIY